MKTLQQSMASLPFYHNALALHHTPPPRRITLSASKTTPDNITGDPRRRSANYKPSHWDHHYLLSVDNIYARENRVKERDLLKEKVKNMLDDHTNSSLQQLQLIDDLQRLGLSYHFVKKIDSILTVIYHKNVKKCESKKELHAAALEFRLLRQHGFDVSEDIFDMMIHKIEDDDTLETDDIKDLIALYEASYLSTTLDTKLHKIIRPYAKEKLREIVESNDHIYGIENHEMAVHVLEMPYHWRMRRLATIEYMDLYEKKHDMNFVLAQFAKIDFNLVQAVHQKDLKYVCRWWKETGLSDKLKFARDRIVENYFWSVGINEEVSHGYVRRAGTIVNVLVTTIDDIYDIYATLDELEIFTDIVDNWDVNRVDELPEYMKLCFLVLYNETNGIGYNILKNQNVNVIPFLKKSWGDLCKAYLVEAKWHKRGYIPKVEEYLENGVFSSASPTVLLHFYCVSSDQISTQFLETLSQHKHHFVLSSATILRLSNDLVTFKDEKVRGDVPKSIQCYMNERGATEKEARAYIQQLISDAWDDMNYIKTASSSSLIPPDFVEAAMNLARMSQCMYQYGDGHGSPDKARIVGRIRSLLMDPIHLN